MNRQNNKDRNMIPPHGKHHRRSIRLRDFDYSQPGAYFVTLCTWNRECLFGMVQDEKMQANLAGEIISEKWRLLPGRFPGVVLDEMVVMPNHIHGIIHINVGAIHELPLHKLSQHEFPKRALIQNELPHHESFQHGLPQSKSSHELPLHKLSQNELPKHLQRRGMLLPKVVGFFKMNAAKRINQLHQTPGYPVWQRNYYEHVIRNEKALNAIRRYIQSNPAMWPHDSDNPNSRYSILDMTRNTLAQHYGFTDEELDFIINYDIKYRMGQEPLGEEE